MSMVCGLDLHRQQITFDALVVESGESWRGRVWQPDRERFRRWLRDDVTPSSAGRAGGVGGGGLHGLAVCGRRDHRRGVRGACRRAGRHARMRVGRKHRAKTDRTDARLIRELLQDGRFAGVVDPADRRARVARAGAVVQVVDRSAHHVGATHPRRAVSAWCRGARGSDPLRRDPGPARRRRGAAVAGGPAADPGRLSDDRRDRHRSACRSSATCNASVPASPACRALVDAHYGIGGLIAVAVWSELGDCRRFSRSRQAVRHTGLDVTVDASDRRRAGGYLSRQGPRDVAVGAVRSCEELVTSTQSRPRVLRARSKTVTAARSPRSRSPASSPAAATTSCATSIPTSSTRSRPDPDRDDGAGRLFTTSGSTAISSCNRRARQHSCWTAS